MSFMRISEWNIPREKAPIVYGMLFFVSMVLGLPIGYILATKSTFALFLAIVLGGAAYSIYNTFFQENSHANTAGFCLIPICIGIVMAYLVTIA